MVHERGTPDLKIDFYSRKTWDFYNKIIADNDRVFQVHLSLDEVKNFDETIFRLRNIIDLSNNEVTKIYKTKDKLKPWDTLVVSDNLN